MATTKLTRLKNTAKEIGHSITNTDYNIHLGNNVFHTDSTNKPLWNGQEIGKLPVLNDLHPQNIPVDWTAPFGTIPPQHTFQYKKGALNGPPNDTGGIVVYQGHWNIYDYHLEYIQVTAYSLDESNINTIPTNTGPTWPHALQNEIWTIFYAVYNDFTCYQGIPWTRNVNINVTGKIRAHYMHIKRRIIINASELHSVDMSRCLVSIGVGNSRPSRSGQSNNNVPFWPREDNHNRVYQRVSRVQVRHWLSKSLSGIHSVNSRTIPYVTTTELYNNCLFMIANGNSNPLYFNFVDFCKYLKSNPVVVTDPSFKFYFRFGNSRRMPIRKFKYRFFAVKLNVLLLSSIRQHSYPNSNLYSYKIEQTIPFELHMYKNGSVNMKFF